MSGAMPVRMEDFGIEENFDRRQYGQLIIILNTRLVKI